jgi:glutamate dehydrogenase (NAD(P)+)
MYRKAADERMRQLRGLTRLEEIGRRIVRAVEETYETVRNDRHTDVLLIHKVVQLDLPMRIVTEAAMRKFNMHPENTRIVIQGFGNVGSVAAKEFANLGCKVIAISDVTGAYYNPNGIDIDKAIQYKAEHDGLLEDFQDGDKITNEELLELDCDVLAPCALEDQITSKNADRIKAKIIVEGANGPTTSKADPILNDKGIIVIPDILANAGGVTVSYFEWVQDRMGYFWPRDSVNEREARILTEAFDAVSATAERHNVSLRIGAYILAIDRVTKTLKLRGIYG